VPRVLVIGIDGAAPAALERWMGDGELPALASLRERGCFGPMRSTPNMMSPSAWTSIATGVNPGRHGIFGFFDRVPGTRRFAKSDARARCADPWWVIASRAGARTLTLNMPCSWPVDEVNGLQVAGWLAPCATAPGFTHPPGLADELRRIFRAYPVHSDVLRLVAARRHEAARRRITQNLRRKAEIAEHLIGREGWDLMCVVFSDTDAAQHYYWHLSDPSHPARDDRLRDRVGDIVLAAYREVDRAVGRLIARADNPDAVMVVSDHGAGRNHGGPLYLPPLLDRLGWQVRRRSWWWRAARALRDRVPAGLKHRIAGRARERASELVVGDIDWARTLAFSFCEGGRADIWLTGERDDRERTVREVRDTLMQCRDRASGEAVIDELPHRDDLYQGPLVARAPDLLVRWRDDIPDVSGLRCGGVEVDRPERRHLQTGAHRRHGVLLVAGEGIRGGRIAEAAVEDVMPTLLHLCGLPVPGYVDGRVIRGLFREPPEVAVDERASLPEPGEAEEAVDERVRDRLRGLGYL